MRVAVGVALLSLVAATPSLSAQGRETPSGPSTAVTSYDVARLQPPHLLNEYQVPGLMRFYYPPSFRKHPVNDQVILSFQVDTLGKADLSSVQVLQGTHPELVAATKSVVARLRFTPGVILGDTAHLVPVSVTLPLVWAAK